MSAGISSTKSLIRPLSTLLIPFPTSLVPGKRLSARPTHLSTPQPQRFTRFSPTLERFASNQATESPESPASSSLSPQQSPRVPKNQPLSGREALQSSGPEVDISLFSRLLDPHPSECGPYHQIFFGSKPPFTPLSDEVVRQSQAKGGNDAIIESLPPNSLTDREIKQLHKYPLVVKRVVNQTGKGKIPSMYTLVVVGNGKGLVGYGEGKSETIGGASTKALRNAIRNMSPVHLFEDRTIHTELKSKFHATEIVMRPRPAGQFLLSKAGATWVAHRFYFDSWIFHHFDQFHEFLTWFSWCRIWLESKSIFTSGRQSCRDFGPECEGDPKQQSDERG